MAMSQFAMFNYKRTKRETIRGLENAQHHFELFQHVSMDDWLVVEPPL
jgi:hypothetical protein